MKIAGLFIGVSRLADPGITELQFAHCDATALHAVFADSNAQLGASPTMCRLLVNAEATKERVLSALAEVIADANSGNADLVIVHLSCHGSPSGSLVLYDSSRNSVDDTGIPVRVLIEALSSVRDRPVVLTLDCCFAGTALGLSDSPNREAFNSLMHGFEDQSRIVGCAADFGQSAYEDREFGKGLFSHALWSRLQEAFDTGTSEVSAFDWVRDAVQRTTDLAKTKGRAQAATAFVTVRNARISLRIPRERPHQLRLIVPADLPAVTEEVESLTGHGLDSAAVQAVRARLGPSARLNQLQRDAVSIGGILRHQSVFVRAPTSAGKTLVAELAVLGHQHTGRKAVVLLPLRALAREHAQTFRSAYSSLGLRVIVSTGDAHDEDDLLIRGQFEVAFLTFEKFCAIISARPDLQQSIGLIVFDELQTIADDGRGHTLELLLVQVRRWRDTSQWPQLVVLCGELADLTDLQRWLNLPVVATTHRPVPLEESVIRVTTGGLRVMNRESGSERRETWAIHAPAQLGNDDRERRRNAALPVIRKLLSDGKQILVFCSEKPQARRMALALAQTCGLKEASTLVGELRKLDVSTDHRTRALLRDFAKAGVGLHLADLSEGERNAVEDAFRSRELKVLVATSTLGQGVNLPADAVVFVDDLRWNGHENAQLSSVDYRNISGRAGRLIPGGPSIGLSVLIAQGPHAEQDLWERYVVSPPASLKSSLGDLANEDLVMLLLRQFETATVNDITGALAATYWAASERIDPKWRRARRTEMEGSLGRLEDAGLVRRISDIEWQLTPLGRIAAGYGLTWISAKRVAHGVQKICEGKEPFDSTALFVLALTTEEILDCRCPAGATSVPTSRKGRFAARPALWDILTAADGPGLPGDRLHKLEAVGKWLSGSALRDVEAYFARGASDDAVAGLFFNLLHRLNAILPAIGAISWLQAPASPSDPREVAGRLRLQLSIGGSREAAGLHRLRLGLTRGQCLKMVEMGIRDPASLRDALANRRDSLSALLSTPDLQRLEALLGDRRHQSRIEAPEPQLILEGFD